MSLDDARENARLAVEPTKRSDPRHFGRLIEAVGKSLARCAEFLLLICLRFSHVQGPSARDDLPLERGSEERKMSLELKIWRPEKTVDIGELN